ncbi:tRNA modification GTPase GTPBP3, mitochondrial [Strongyloides ratti]|uniref:tRNA modification GTPase GTPBP3, mitochondrial n=1 Tax=Strongyloides ratti TaxID=34506 RepID=A0A090LJ28_STRRB|nr:tRNA modification GTPase GTPBP3, mitochondrial [Strongyloides ratti]CEF67530.1 tRNA modification GTPase GTPBP3, mitochondrial [Strongyloides ratti]
MRISSIVRCALNLRHNIYAVSSGSVPSAIAIVRLSGKDALSHIKKLTRKEVITPRKMFYSPLYDKDGDIIDKSMVVYLKGPNTFTGEDTAEFFVHGGRAVVRSLCNELALLKNTDYAKAGEFTRRALINKKMDLAQVEALSDLIAADSDAQRKQALKSDSIGIVMKPLREKLLNLIAQYEASIDFADDVISNSDSVINDAKKIINELEKLEKSSKRGTLIKDGISVVLVGRTNVGKSSLMNRIAENDIALVSDIHGTTRDFLETRIQLNGLLLIITDTAGIRNDSIDVLELKGIERSINKANNADIIVIVIDGSNCLDINNEVEFLSNKIKFNEKKRKIICINKSDLFETNNMKFKNLDKFIITSTVDSNGIDNLIKKLSAEATSLLEDSHNNSDFVLSQQRHIQLIKRSKEFLENFIINTTIDRAIAAENLRECADSIGEITGTIVNEDILDSIFNTFCIGK